MKKVFNKFSSKGFTLIELLVVIAVIGVLAVALSAAINPIAKINSAKDSTVKSDMGQLVNALQAYYTGQSVSAYPAGLSTLTTNELKTLPKQQGGGLGPCTASADYGYTSDSANKAAVWGCLFTTGGTTYWCWDSTNGKIKSTNTAPASPSYTCQ